MQDWMIIDWLCVPWHARLIDYRLDHCAMIYEIDYWRIHCHCAVIYIYAIFWLIYQLGEWFIDWMNALLIGWMLYWLDCAVMCEFDWFINRVIDVSSGWMLSWWVNKCHGRVRVAVHWVVFGDRHRRGCAVQTGGDPATVFTGECTIRIPQWGCCCSSSLTPPRWPCG